MSRDPHGSLLRLSTGPDLMSRIFLTGFPGFLGSELLSRLLSDRERRATCLVQGRYADLARSRREELEARHPELKGRIDLVEGDITIPDLGLDEGAVPREEVSQVFHLAAVYDLEVSRAVGTAVNVEGTRNVLNFAVGCPELERFQYVSTCYVSGRHAGIFRESDLAVGQSFNNYYEETKFLAEGLVERRRKQGFPVTIYRPASVVGDSRTGATQKLDGPYYYIKLLLRQPRLAFAPLVGDPTAVRVNLVPRDFVIDAMAYLAALPESRGRVYQLADPSPLTVEELVQVVAEACERDVIPVRLPRKLAKAALEYVPGVRALLRLPPPLIDYFVHPTFYTTTQTQEDLAGSGIAVPPFQEYVGRLVDYVRENPDIGSRAMA